MHGGFDDLLGEFAGIIGDELRSFDTGDTVERSRNDDFFAGIRSEIDQFVVHIDNVLTFLTEGLGVEFLHTFFGFFVGNDAGKFEVSDHHDGVGTFAAETGLALHDGFRVDVVELDLLVDDGFLHIAGQLGEDFIVAVMAVQQEGTAFFDAFEQVITADVSCGGAGNEVRARDEVGGLDRAVRETQVRAGQTERLLGVVCEVSLCIFVGVHTDDLDGGLVCTDRTIAAETVEHAVCGTGRFGNDLFVDRDAGVGDVIGDTDGETMEGICRSEVLVDRQDHGGAEFLGGKTVTAADDGDFGVVDRNFDVQIQRFADGAGFFGTVENSDAFDGLGQSFEERFGKEGTIETDFDQTVLGTAYFVQVGDGFFDGFAGRTHSNDHIGCIFSADVVEEFVFSAGDSCDFVHVFLDDGGSCIVELVDRFAALEVDVTILGADFGDGLFGTESAFAEFLDVFVIHEFRDVFVRDFFEFVDFVRSTETVEELEERNFGFVSCQVSNKSQVHFFLNAVSAEHGETGVTASHHVRVVTEDGERLTCESACCDMEDGREKFTGDLVHVGDHQEQTLRSGVGGGQRPGCQTAVNGTGGTCFGLHFSNVDFFAPDVFLVFACPLVNPFAHGGRRSDGVNSSGFAQCISDVRGGIITVLCVDFSRHSFILLAAGYEDRSRSCRPALSRMLKI